MLLERIDAWLLKKHQQLAHWWTDTTRLSHFHLCRVLALVVICSAGAMYLANRHVLLMALCVSLGFTILVIVFFAEWLANLIGEKFARTAGAFYPFGVHRLCLVAAGIAIVLPSGIRMLMEPSVIRGAPLILVPALLMALYLACCSPRPPRPQEQEELVLARAK